VQKLLREGGTADLETETIAETAPGADAMLFPLDPAGDEVEAEAAGTVETDPSPVRPPGAEGRPGKRVRALPEPVRVALEEIAGELIEIRGLLVKLMQHSEPR
jgi:hypothetical protein